MSSCFLFWIVYFKELFSICFLKIIILHHVLLWWFVLHFRNAKQLHNKSLEECTWGLFVMVINKWTLAIVDKQKIMNNSGRLSKSSEHDFSPLATDFIVLSHNPLEMLQERCLSELADGCHGWAIKPFFDLLQGTCATQLCQEQRHSASVENWLRMKTEEVSSCRCLTIEIKQESNLVLYPLTSSKQKVHYRREVKL